VSLSFQNQTRKTLRHRKKSRPSRTHKHSYYLSEEGKEKDGKKCRFVFETRSGKDGRRMREGRIIEGE